MTNSDLATHPVVAVWETNQARHDAPILAESLQARESRELSATEAEKLIRDVADLRAPVFVFAGANPLARPGIMSLVRYACSCGLRPSMVLSDSPLLTRQAIEDLKAAGLSRCGITLQGSTAELHESFSGSQSSLARAIQGMRWVNERRLLLQVHTQISRANVHDLENMAAVLKGFRAMLWSLAFPVIADPGRAGENFTAEEFEEIFERIYSIAQTVEFKIKTVDADHYRRYVTQQRTLYRVDKMGALCAPFREHGIPGVFPVNEARGTIFISSSGEVYPSSQITVSAGNVRRERLRDIYRESQMFRDFRDLNNLKGKCGLCEYKEMCGGSRARAWAMAGDMFAEDDSCVYQPSAMLAYKAG
ncbi:MAG TPA: radical SAM protein [Candidatus Angelobacter sp.]